MVSIISWLIDPFLKIIKVRRMPPAKALNANLLGLSIGLFLIFLVLGFQYTALFELQPWYSPLLLLTLFLLGTYFLGGLFALFVAVAAFVLSKLSIAPGTFLYALEQLTLWNTIGYAFGALFATFYNDLVFLYLILFEKHKIKIAFSYLRKKVFNIIKSPDAEQEEAFQILLNREATEEKKEKLRKLKLYDYQLDGAPEQPYTILFVANPFVLKRLDKDGLSEIDAKQSLGDHRKDPTNYELDPIIKDPDLFYFSVDRALRSFESNEVLGRPEIWSRVRVVTIFDSKLKGLTGDARINSSLVGEFQGELTVDGNSPLNLMDGLPEMKQRVEVFLARYQNGGEKLAIETGDIDLIFAMSAWPTHDRSTAHFSDYNEDIGRVEEEIRRNGASELLHEIGQEFTFNPDPHKNKDQAGNPVVNIDTHFPIHEDKTREGAEDTRERTFHHEYHISEPGRVALNVVGAIQRTFIHEFAHAMSSMHNGVTTDEYADVFDLKSDEYEPRQNIEAPFYVNRIERQKQAAGKFIPVHQVFGDYNCTVFQSNLRHPSAKENWLGYFPETHGPGTACIMDRFASRHRFDKVISNFMYDRLVAKLNRPRKVVS